MAFLIFHDISRDKENKNGESLMDSPLYWCIQEHDIYRKII
ncbi:hypothetical protein HMPREF9086_3920 [Enterobacter hormaechei ATCC 49162]|nr:hypothetical protein HMPREF9086_3920 [Enterobacter hormaechei ATCC 49162]